MNIVHAVVGLVLLLAGRRLFWLFVALAGFLAGMRFAENILVDASETMLLLAAVGAGLVGAVLAVVFQRAAFAIVGFLAGGYLGLVLAQHAGAAEQALVIAGIAGVLGAIVVSLIADAAIILLSSLVGAAAIVGAFPVQQPVVALIGWLVLTAAGIGVQRRQQITARVGSG